MLEKLDQAEIFGLKVHNVSMDETLEIIDHMIKGQGSHLVVTLGTEMVMRAEQDEDFCRIVNMASLVVPDSVGILWACARKGHPLRERVPGVDILYAAAKNHERYPWRVFFLGAKPGVAEQAAEKIKTRYPGFNIVGTFHGYFKEDTEALEKIREADPQLLFIALGSPAQEKWFMKNRDKLSGTVAIGIGGSLDVVSENVKRAPVFFRKTGMEWLYRLISEPSRFKRMTALPLFAWKVITKGDEGK